MLRRLRVPALRSGLCHNTVASSFRSYKIKLSGQVFAFQSVLITNVILKPGHTTMTPSHWEPPAPHHCVHVCVCMCACAYVCTCAYMCVPCACVYLVCVPCVHVCLRVPCACVPCVSMCVHVWASVPVPTCVPCEQDVCARVPRVCACACVRVHVCMHVPYVCACLCVPCMSVHACVCLCVCRVCVCVPVRVHTADCLRFREQYHDLQC